ncbi:N-alpha-acetyltransferase 30 [Tilletia horrida]|uniref:N-alpha-acetyltransferase 30 n=1 Tax=Tilletia horrida TaxID=155126 RepID=A0AAN6JZK4_9BASI|nr:N-alpha-acetyltransferase 30 [Tilletia horrida]KAK0563972.1 N-alpha-acetyltransferase 30 [Tilletia horrida]
MATTLPPFASTSTAGQSDLVPLLCPPPAPDPDFEYDIELVTYRGEHQLGAIIGLIEKELSEPYLIYTYRYFLNEWPHLAWLAHSIPRQPRPPPLPPRPDGELPTDGVQGLTIHSKPDPTEQLQRHGEALQRRPVGVIVNKMDKHLKGDRLMRGYIAMLSIHPAWRNRGIARKLVQAAVDQMAKAGAEEVVLETEVDNLGALALYEALGFMREKRLYRFYLNAKDSFRLVLPLEGISDDEKEEILKLQAPPPTETSLLGQATATTNATSQDSQNTASFGSPSGEPDDPGEVDAQT